MYAMNSQREIASERKIARFLFAMILGLLLASCTGAEQDDEEEVSISGEAVVRQTMFLSMAMEEQEMLGIVTTVLAPGGTSTGVTVYGTIVPDQTAIAEVVPVVPGRVVAVNVAPGDEVVSGQTLAVLESVEVGSARSAYQQARSEAAVTEAGLARAETLVAGNIIPQKDYLRAKADAERAHAVLRASADQLRLYKVPAEVEASEQADATYPLLAPFAGTLIERNAVLGELAQTEQPLFIIADLRVLWLEADIHEKDLARLGTGVPARITVAAYPDRVFNGMFTYLGDTMDPIVHTVRARIEVDNSAGILKPGMYATAILPSAIPDETLVVPEDAVALFLGEPSVFVVASPEGFEVRIVETGAVFGGMITVTSGLAPGEQVVVEGGYEIKARLLKSQYGDDD